MRKRLVILLMATVVIFSFSGCKKSPEVEAVENQIESFGEVNEESGEKIKEIEDAYNALEKKDQRHVKNRKKLAKYEEEYNKLFADKVVEMIDKIDTSDINAIEEASAEYSKLTDDQKKLVSNYDVLEGLEKKLACEVEKLIKTALENGTEENYRAAENAYLALSDNIKSQITDYSEMANAYLKYTKNIKTGNCKFSDIFVTINNYNIPSVNYNGDMYIALDDIKNYGFDVSKSQNTITISRNSKNKVNPIETYRCADVSVGKDIASMDKANCTTVINGTEVQIYESLKTDFYSIRAKDLANLENVRFGYDSDLKCIKIYVNDGLEMKDTLKKPDIYNDIVGNWNTECVRVENNPYDISIEGGWVMSLNEDRTVTYTSPSGRYQKWEYINKEGTCYYIRLYGDVGETTISYDKSTHKILESIDYMGDGLYLRYGKTY